jgi:hypothetical protein
MRELLKHSGKVSVSCATAALILFLAAHGCSLFQQGAKEFKEMTPKERSLWLMSVYNQEYELYKAKAAEPDKLTEEDKKILRLKKTAMLQAWPVLKAYNSMIRSGVWTEELEQKALDAVTKLIGIGGGPEGGGDPNG